MVELFTPAEFAHMTDVRRVFIGAQVAALVATAVAVLLAVRAARRGRAAALVLVRDAAFAAGLGVAGLAAAAAVAFDPLFLLFHELFFPQGNFLFPSGSALLALYPDPYWYGVTLRVGLSFVGIAAAIALSATATLRRARR